MMMMAICTSVTSILHRCHAFTEVQSSFGNLTQTKVQLTGQSALSQTRRSATGHRRTWTFPRNHRRTSSSGTDLFHRKYTFPRQQRLKAEERDRWRESHSCSNQKQQMITAVSEHLWRRHRSRGQRSPPGQRRCWCAWTASHRWHQGTGRRRGRMHSTQRPTMEPSCEEVKKQRLSKLSNRCVFRMEVWKYHSQTTLGACLADAWEHFEWSSDTCKFNKSYDWLFSKILVWLFTDQSCLEWLSSCGSSGHQWPSEHKPRPI